MFKRLTKNDEESWALYPKFEKRVIDFTKQFDIGCPIEPIVYEMQQRWVSFPNLAGYFLGLHDNIPYAHVAAWITTNYNQNKLYIYQAQADSNFANFDQVWPQVQDWIANLNYGLSTGLKVLKTEFCTWHDPEFWARYFRKKGLTAVKTRHVIEADIFADVSNT